MGSTKHERTFVDYDKTYEQNIIGMRGIIYFAVGLTALIVITFLLMWFLLNVMEDQALDAEKSGPQNPMMMKGDELLPPEPRLQAAPGFGVEGPNGRVSLELQAPQSEWRQLQSQWKDELEFGQRSGNTVITMPIEEAKQKLLQENVKARPLQADGQNPLDESRKYVSYGSGGRLAAEKRR
jgi:hypothetical protein